MFDMSAPHIPVLIDPILTHAAPVKGTWIDGTFGAGGYTRALLDAGADRVIGIDQDPMVFEMAAAWASEFDGKLDLIEGRFGDLDELTKDASPIDGVVLDIGVSSMQLDQAERGFSFMADGPLDMRMGQSGLSAADLVNRMREADLADVLYQFGEERASRRVAGCGCPGFGRGKADLITSANFKVVSKGRASTIFFATRCEARSSPN